MTMKRVLLFVLAVLFASFSFAQMQEDFDPAPTGWILSQGANFQSISSMGGVVTPGVGGNNPAQVGTPAVNKTSNTFEVCFDIYAYTSNLNSQVPFPCNTYVDVLFVKSTVTNATDAALPGNILARVDNYLLPSAGGNTCFNFTFPANVTDATFKVFLSFHADCGQGGIKYFIDNVNISGVNLICGGVNCPPGASNDMFNRPVGEASFNAVLYGAPIDPSYPALPAGFANDATGTDGDQNDTYSHLQWKIITPPTNGTVVINADGTATISRSSSNVIQMTFSYQVCDDGPDNNFATTGDNMCSNIATVTVNWPVGFIMPVTLTSFTAVRTRSSATLKWETATESNNTGFEILKSTNNGAFQKIGFVMTKSVGGNSSNKLAYEFTDASLGKGVTLYRLKQVDIDGRSQLSEIRSVKGEGIQGSVTIFPTPSTTGDVSVSVTGIQSYDLYLMDMNGKVIKEVKRSSADYVKLTNLQSGMYMLKIVDISTGDQSNEKILVNRR